MIDPRRVAGILREVSAEVILPRYKRLAPAEVREKRPGDYVTVADTEAERLIASRLAGLLPGARVVGEESVAADASTLDRLTDAGPVWIIDPIDGTANFVKGRDKFAIILALVVGGRVVQGWIHDPLADRTAIAEAGAGAWIGETRLCIRQDTPLAAMAGSAGYRRNERLSRAVAHLARQGSAAHDYLALLDNTLHFAYFRRLHPWDHAAGVLLHSEAGGYNALLDGHPYEPLPSDSGLLLAPDRASWEELAGLVGR